MALKQLGFCWGVSSFYGWGVYGMNLALQMAQHHREIELTCGSMFSPGDVVLDPMRERIIGELAQRSEAACWKPMSYGVSGAELGSACPVLRGLMNDLVPGAGSQGIHWTGQPNIGVAFIEDASITQQGKDRSKEYALIIAGSTWNRDILRGHGINNVVTVLQGVDPSIFHEAPKTGMFPNRFVVFSGGKLEFRKGQDITLAAFRVFHARHPDALLVAAWGSPWPHLAAQATGRPDIEPFRDSAERWAADNGIPADSFISLGQTPNIAMPHVIRECDVALFPNRAEGGTNLAAMECMACGIPTILSANTGHLDLMDFGGDRLALAEQKDVRCEGIDTTAWGESSVDEIIERLEDVYRRRGERIPHGSDTSIRSLTWRRQINRLISEIEKVV